MKIKLFNELVWRCVFIGCIVLSFVCCNDEEYETTTKPTSEYIKNLNAFKSKPVARNLNLKNAFRQLILSTANSTTTTATTATTAKTTETTTKSTTTTTRARQLLQNITTKSSITSPNTTNPPTTISSTTTRNSTTNEQLNTTKPTSNTTLTSIITSSSTSPSLTVSNTTAEQTKNKTQPTYLKNLPCHFPFIYQGVQHAGCTLLDRTEPWCSVTANYDKDKQWKYCFEQRVRTTGGNSEGANCHFPFVYSGVTYNECIDEEYIDENNKTSYVKFCATTDNYDRDKKWGLCLDYSTCFFPFVYENKVYNDCISNYLSPRFCSTTDNFDRDKKWSSCPIVCSGFPEKSDHVISFNNSYHKHPCIIKEYKSKYNGLKLRNYVVGPCQVSYVCAHGYRRLYDEIECKLDGHYDKHAYCISENFFH